jgi:hemoglobin-like flavoprotein
MDPQSERLVRETWEMLLPVSDSLIATFYTRLFGANPDLAGLFSDTDMPAQRRKFTAMISEIVRAIDRPELLVSEISDSGRRHVGYGVNDRDYEDVGAALLWAVDHSLGERSTPEIRRAWREAYDLVSAVMRRAAHASDPAGER